MPNPNKNESENDFVNRCVEYLTKEGKGSDNSQRVAICHSRYKQAKAAQDLVDIIYKGFENG